jgi:DNA-directed RNA polymerase subunit RPC12/RpoP
MVKCKNCSNEISRWRAYRDDGRCPECMQKLREKSRKIVTQATLQLFYPGVWMWKCKTCKRTFEIPKLTDCPPTLMPLMSCPYCDSPKIDPIHDEQKK